MTRKIKKIRLDKLLSAPPFALSIDDARKKIITGWVRVDGETVRDPKKGVDGSESVTLSNPSGRFVSRGGEKLRHALDEFRIDLVGEIAADFGASTGGFTDCMLKAGAVKVYAVDVGFNQLDYSLRIDSRVVVMEKTHIRDINSGMFPETPGFFTADLSFISIVNALKYIYNTFDAITGIVLVKPQFEAEPGQLVKGIVKEMSDHITILENVLNGIIKTGFTVQSATHSPIRGNAGNIEFLFLLKKYQDSDTDIANITFENIEITVKTAHDLL